MGATFSRLKNWVAEILTYADLNAEIDNILNNLGPAGVDDYSTNAAQMRTQTSPGTLGAESLATSLAGELERLRYVIQRMIGGSTTYWYETPPSSLSDLVSALGTGLPDNRISSGLTSAGSSQMRALIPNGSAPTLKLDGTPTPFVYYVDGVQYTINSDVNITSLGLAPTVANSTCTVNDAASVLAGGTGGAQMSKWAGQYGMALPIANLASEVTAKVGQIAAFKNGTEYLIGYVSTTALFAAWRGCMIDSSSNPINAVTMSHSTTLTLQRLAWIFANTNGSMAVTYNSPVVSAEQPSSPSTGDYWFDLENNTWKIFNSTVYVPANATLIGMSVQDTANCVAARTFDSFQAQSDLNTFTLDRISSTQVQAKNMFAEVCVFGRTSRYGNSRPTWDMTTDLDSGVTEAASTYYFLYIKENGTTVISDIAPMQRADLGGMYHPQETWRAIGQVYNDASSNLVAPVLSYINVQDLQFHMGNPKLNVLNNSVNIEPDFYYESYSTASSVWPHAGNSWGGLATISDVQPGIYEAQAVLQLSGGVATPTATIVEINCQNVSAGYSGGDMGLGRVQGHLSAISAHCVGLRVNCRIIVSTPSVVYMSGTMLTTASSNQIVGRSLRLRRVNSLIGQPG